MAAATGKNRNFRLILMSKKKAAVEAHGPTKAAKKKNVEKRRTLKPRQAKALEAIVKGEVPRQAILDAGYSQRTADHPGEFMDTASMREAMSRLLASPEKIAQRINEGLDAMETVFAKFEGKITDQIDVIAWSERRMYADLAAELKGMKPSQKIEHSGQTKMIIEMVDVAAQESA